MSFQEYFVYHRCQPHVTGFRFERVDIARPSPNVLESIDQAEVVIFCPSNPWVSIDPILAIPGIRQAVKSRPVVAVSPIIGGQTVKGPAAKMYLEMGIEPSALAVCQHYAPLLLGFVLDRVDAPLAQSVKAMGVFPHEADTLMRTPQDRCRLAKEVLEFTRQVLS
jgi:LPPG:FO 2-phospho-L-lactate transferase